MIDLNTVSWNEAGLVPVIAQDTQGNVLMLAYANRQALEKTLETRQMHYWSRSRGCLWHKGESSGNVQTVVSLQLDCDRDTVLARVVSSGPACHTGADTCFGAVHKPILDELWRVFERRAAAQDPDSYVKQLLSDERRLRQKVGEEGVEVALADQDDDLVYEAADLVFHLCVLLFARKLGWSDVLDELERRRP